MKRFVAVLLVLGLAGCGSSPKTHFYTLNPVPAHDPVQQAARGGPIEVGHVTLPGTLDRIELVTHGIGDQIEISDQARWAAPLDELMQRTLTADLRSRLPAGSVLSPGDPTPHKTRTISLNVATFMANETGHVRLDADWSTQQGSARHETIEIALHGQGDAAVADAMSRALGVLADRIAAAA